MKRLFLIVVAIAFMLPTVAQAQSVDDFVNEPWLVDECGQYWPSIGGFELQQDGDRYRAVMLFSFNADEVAALQCVSNQLWVDFKIYGFDKPGNYWNDYMFDSNLPGIKDAPVTGTETALDNSPKPYVMPRISNINTVDLVPHKIYYASVSFSGLNRNHEERAHVSFQMSAVNENVSHAGDVEVSRVYLSSGVVDDWLYFPSDSFDFWFDNHTIIEPN